MKNLLILLLISLPALSVPESLYNMRPNRDYMSFAATKYLSWHEKKFQFPLLTPLEQELVGQLNHWVIPETEARSQLSVCHREDKGKGITQSLRLWIAPELRNKKELSVIPGFSPEFYERNSDGIICLIHGDAYCQRAGEKKWILDHREKVMKGHLSWNNRFPLLSEEEVRYSDPGGNVTAIGYHRGISHVSLIPQSLLMIVRGHSLDTAFGMDRYILEKDGTMSACYP